MLNKPKETMKKPKCISCDKTLRRVTQDIRNQKESYKGNLICYMKKKIIVDGFLIPSLNIKKGDTIYSYRLWDGESYHYYLGKYKFCGVNCAAKYGIKQLTKETMTKQRKLIQVKYPPFDTTVKTYADIYKYEDEMTEKDHKDLKAEIFKNKQWTK